MTLQQQPPLPAHNSPNSEDGVNAAAVYIACGVIFAISAALTVYLCRSMSGGMDMPGGWIMSMMWMRMPGQTWLASTAMFMLMWLTMMLAMMLPSAIPMLVNFRRFCYCQGERRLGFATLTMGAGYFFVWLVIGMFVYVAGIGIGQMTMHSERLSQLVPTLSGLGLILCGLFNFTPWKMAALKRCRDPFVCAAGHHGGILQMPFRCGVRQGLCCAICTSGPMLGFLILGVCNLVVMIFVAGIVTLEKVAPRPILSVRTCGLALVATGLVMLACLH